MSEAFVKQFEILPYTSGQLSGLTFSVKDLIDIEGYKTGGGNPDWEKAQPRAAAHALCVEQLLQEGAICLGKTISDELAFGLLGENHFYGTPLNPKAPDRVPGGSSSGSASAVASGAVDFALGTDTGGSVRTPASNCGIFGFRPSHGRISLAGVIPFAPSFDTVGILAKEAIVLGKVATTLLGSDKHISSISRKIYILEDAFTISDSEVIQGLQTPLKEIPVNSTVTLQDIFQESITFEDLLSVFCALQWAEIWSSLGSWIEEKHPQFGPHTAENFNLAKNFERRKIQENVKKRMKIKEKVNSYLGQGRILCIPTTTSLAPKKDTIGMDRTKGDYYPRLLSLNALAGLASLPQITLPLGSYHSIPIGLSFIASAGEDEFLLQSVLKFCE